MVFSIPEALSAFLFDVGTDVRTLACVCVCGVCAQGWCGWFFTATLPPLHAHTRVTRTRAAPACLVASSWLHLSSGRVCGAPVWGTGHLRKAEGIPLAPR